jgi:kinesin family protein 6/9
MDCQATIQIYCRVRPTKPHVRISDDRYWIKNPEIIDKNDPDSVPKLGFFIPKDFGSGMINNQKENYEFRFDRVFGMDTKQGTLL